MVKTASRFKQNCSSLEGSWICSNILSSAVYIVAVLGSCSLMAMLYFYVNDKNGGQPELVGPLRSVCSGPL